MEHVQGTRFILGGQNHGMTRWCVDGRPRVVKDLQLAVGICYSRSRIVVTSVGIDSLLLPLRSYLDRFEHCFHIY